MGPNPREQIKEKSFKIASGMKKCGRLVHNTICLNFPGVMLLQKDDLFDVDRGWFLCIENAQHLVFNPWESLQVQFEKSDKSFQIATVPHIFGLSYSTYSKKKTCSNGCLLVMSFEFLCGCTFLQLKTILIRCSLVMREQKAGNYCDHLASSLP